MLGEIVAYSLGKAVAKRRYRRRENGNNKFPGYCLGCGDSGGKCGNFEDFCIECCNCTEHTD